MAAKKLPRQYFVKASDIAIYEKSDNLTSGGNERKPAFQGNIFNQGQFERAKKLLNQFQLPFHYLSIHLGCNLLVYNFEYLKIFIIILGSTNPKKSATNLTCLVYIKNVMRLNQYHWIIFTFCFSHDK